MFRIDLPGHYDLFASIGEQPLILALRRHGFGYGPEDGAVILQDDERRTLTGAGLTHFAADRLIQVFSKSACRVENPTSYGFPISGRSSGKQADSE